MNLSHYLMILVLVQALTEFLPISSSAHLRFVGYFFNCDNPQLFAALHLGTTLSIFLYFFKYYWRETKVFFVKPFSSELTLIKLATIPTLFFGFITYKFIHLKVSFLLMGIFGSISALILYLTDSREQNYKKINWYQALFIGLIQCFALIPGMSRMGMTVSAGRLLKIDRVKATEFSIIIAAPITLGAFILSYNKNFFNLEFFILTLLEAFLGYVILYFFFLFIRKHTYFIFVLYRVVFSIILICLGVLEL